MVSITYLSPKGRRMVRDDLTLDEARVVARRIAQRPGVGNVCIWSGLGFLLAKVARA